MKKVLFLSNFDKTMGGCGHFRHQWKETTYWSHLLFCQMYSLIYELRNESLYVEDI